MILTAGGEDAEGVAALESVATFEPRTAPWGRAPGGGSTGVSNDGTLVLARDLDFPVWGAVLQQAVLVVTPNTAAIHLSSAVGCPVVAVYASERYAVNSRQWAPWMVPHRVLMKDQPGVTIGRIVDAAADLLAAAQGRTARGQP